MKREDTVDFNIKVIWHAISRMYNQQGQGEGITATSGFVLLNINPDVGTRATKIAPLLGMESTSLSRMLKTMEAQGLVHRKPDPEDGRAVRIFLTKEGRRKREISKKTVLHFNTKIKENIPTKKIAVFFEVIESINKIIESNIFEEIHYETQPVN